MILNDGDKLLIVHRRLYEGDKPRYFVGTVNGYENGIIKVSGYTWIKEHFGGGFIKKNDLRTKIFSISSGTLLVYELPKEIDLKALKLENIKDGQVILSDGLKFRMDMTENENLKTDKKPSSLVRPK